MLLNALVETSAAVASNAARLYKIDQLATTLRRLEPGEVLAAVAFLSGELRQRQIGVGYAAIRDVPGPASGPSLTVAEVDATFQHIGEQAGPGSQARRRQLLFGLFARATATEQRFLTGLLSGELRQGALDGIMAEAVAKATTIPATEVRRALMLRGALGPVAEAALANGRDGLKAFTLQVGRPLRPMLAQTADSIEAAMTRLSPDAIAIEWKLDGVRAQAHFDGDEVRVFTRTLDDITSRVPEVVEVVRALPVESAVLDGEVIALRPDGRPNPFQVTAGRIGSRIDVDRLRGELPLTTYFFDVLHLNGEDLIDRPGTDRRAALAGVVPEPLLIPRIVTADLVEAERFVADTLARGHEGVVVKSLTAPYEAGRRGSGWVKVKPVHTLDLVILAAEWGHGRRKGWLSNLHLGALDPATGGFVMLGKTFKGLTDKMLTWQTERLKQLAISDNGWVVEVRPELLVEIAFDSVQTSPRYPGGMALRFARVLRYREDKRPEEADTIDTVRAIHQAAGA
jgi:ATP-dependent DNA ligase I